MTVGLAALFLISVASAAEPVRMFAAGSLGAALPELIVASGLPIGTVAAPAFGPAGVLRDRLLDNNSADLFASADMEGPAAVVAKHGGLVVPFALNRMYVLAPDRLGLTTSNLLDRLLAPEFLLAASTPRADPGGDYAKWVFKRAGTLTPGAEATLTTKAQLLLGGPGSVTPQQGKSPAASIFLADRADGLLYGCSGTASTARDMPGLVSVAVPDEVEPRPVYGLAVLSDRPEADKRALFMLSARGQAILSRGGLLPLVADSPKP